MFSPILMYNTTMSNIILKIHIVTNVLEKSKGLIGKKVAEPILIQTHFGIHTIGLKFPIDVVILDDNFTVVKLRYNLKPFHIFLWNPKYKKVLELPVGTIEKKKIKIGSKILLK